jgi:hypothetical protein
VKSNNGGRSRSLPGGSAVYVYTLEACFLQVIKTQKTHLTQTPRSLPQPRKAVGPHPTLTIRLRFTSRSPYAYVTLGLRDHATAHYPAADLALAQASAAAAQAMPEAACTLLPWAAGPVAATSYRRPASPAL